MITKLSAFSLVLLMGFAQPRGGPKYSRDYLPEGSAWEGTRSTKEDKFDITGRVLSRKDNVVQLRTKEKGNDGLSLDWTLEVKDTTVRVLRVDTVSRREGDREDTTGVGEVRDDGRGGTSINFDYGWRLKEGKGNGKGKKVEGTVKMRRV